MSVRIVLAFVFFTCSFLFAQNGAPVWSEAKTAGGDHGTGPGREVAAAGARTPERWKALVQERKKLAIRHDMAEWSKFVPDDVVWINDAGQFRTKLQMQQQNSESNPEKMLASDVDDFRVMNMRDATVLIYRTTQLTEINSVPSTASYQTQETYSREGGEWRLRVYHETAIPAKAKIVKIDPRALDEYLGRYEVGPLDVITLKRVGDKLMADESGFPTTEWQSEGGSIFSEGQNHVQFLRNNTGKVTGLAFYPAGQIVQAKKTTP